MTAETPPSRRNAKIAAVLAVVAIVVSAQRLGVFAHLAQPASLARSIRDLGPWGYIAFILAYTLLQPFGIPGTVFVIAAPLLWPWPVAFGLSMAGTMGASSLGFAFARFMGRDWVAARIPDRFKKYNDALERRAFVTVFLLRLVFWMPPVLHAFFGVSKVRASTHFWGSFLGYVPPLFLMSYFGQRLFDALQGVTLGSWLTLAGGAVTAALLVWGVRRSCATVAAARRS